MLRSRWIHAFVVVALLATPLFLFTHRTRREPGLRRQGVARPVGITPGDGVLVNPRAESFQSNHRARGRMTLANTNSATDRPTC